MCVLYTIYDMTMFIYVGSIHIQTYKRVQLDFEKLLQVVVFSQVI